MKKIATREAYGEALAGLGAENPDIVVLDADLAKSTKTIDFAKKFPSRFFDMGVAEANMLGTAAGLAASGKIAFCSTFAVFAIGRAFDQLRNSVCYPKLNVKIAASHAGITVGEDGASHQSVEDIALTRALPNLTVIVPADAAETKKAVLEAIKIKGPVYLRLGRLAVPALHEDDFVFETGKAITMREGSSAAIIAAGLMVAEALAAADELAGEGIDVRVINMHTIKPLDAEAVIRAAQQTKAIVTAEEHSIIGGLGSAVAEVVCEHCPVPVYRVGIKDSFGESGSPADLLQKFGLTSRHIAEAVRKIKGLK